MKTIIHLTIPKQELLKFYRDGVTTCLAKNNAGKVVKFPVAILRPYVSHAGVFGTFEIEYDPHGKFLAIQKSNP